MDSQYQSRSLTGVGFGRIELALVRVELWGAKLRLVR
jgi:hypothetical protein